MTVGSNLDHAAPAIAGTVADAVSHRRYLQEERANAAVHGLGLGLAVAAVAGLLSVAARRGGPWQWTGCGIYAATLLALYAASTLSHLFHRPRLRAAMRTADQAVIFLFIAGSYTPVALTWLTAGPWWALHGLIWGLALYGFVSKAVFAHRVAPERVSAALHLVLGWAPALAVWPLLTAAPGALLLWFLAGGVCYTVGTIFFRYDRVRYFHAAWHAWVIAGSACQYFGVLFTALLRADGAMAKPDGGALAVA